jgi:hypothetical protein
MKTKRGMKEDVEKDQNVNEVEILTMMTLRSALENLQGLVLACSGEVIWRL